MTENDRIAELSYAYLHAVAAAAGFGCKAGNRIDDSASVDAMVRVNEHLNPDSAFWNFDFEVQLKATSQTPVENDGRYSYFLSGTERYDRLRDPGSPLPKILVLLYLPEDSTQWLQIDESALIARRCAYWVSLFGAPQSDNKSGKTIYVPRTQVLTQQSLRDLATRLSLGEDLIYVS